MRENFVDAISRIEENDSHQKQLRGLARRRTDFLTAPENQDRENDAIFESVVQGES